eukprot:14307816-Ditylum_brightwellii.AAC.1
MVVAPSHPVVHVPVPQKMVLFTPPVVMETAPLRVIAPATTPVHILFKQHPAMQDPSSDPIQCVVTPPPAEQLLRLQQFQSTPLNVPAFQRVGKKNTGFGFGEYARPCIIPASQFLRFYAPVPSSMMMHPLWVVQHIVDDNKEKKQTIDDLLKGLSTQAWTTSTANELGYLANGIRKGKQKGKERIGFIQKDQVPK